MSTQIREPHRAVVADSLSAIRDARVKAVRDVTIRVSGYAVNFVRLTREQQQDVLHRTFHGAL